jgi:hypothetical protein
MTDGRKVVPFQLPYMARFGYDVLHHGYNVIPIKSETKEPNINGWQSIKTTDDDIARWLSGRQKNDGIGITTEKTPAIDIDVKDVEFVDEYVRAIELEFGFSPIRIGQAPKALLIFRTTVPFPKITSAEYTDSEGRKGQVEILGKGQQIVAYGVHPDTHKPYEWGADDFNPQTVRAEDLARL